MDVLARPLFAIRLRKGIVPHVPGGRAPLESGLGAKPPYAGVTIAILGDYVKNTEASLFLVFIYKSLLADRSVGRSAVC